MDGPLVLVSQPNKGERSQTLFAAFQDSELVRGFGSRFYANFAYHDSSSPISIEKPSVGLTQVT